MAYVFALTYVNNVDKQYNVIMVGPCGDVFDSRHLRRQCDDDAAVMVTIVYALPVVRRHPVLFVA